MTQKKIILRHLKRHRTITPMQAVKRYAIYRLAHVVYELRGDGVPILTEPQQTGKTTFAKYRLV